MRIGKVRPETPQNAYVPIVRFGLARGTPHQITYTLMDAGLNLNGVIISPESLEPDLEYEYQDPWARIGAHQAAHDLLKIKRAATTLMSAHYEHILFDLEKERSAFRYADFLGMPDAKEKLLQFEG